MELVLDRAACLAAAAGGASDSASLLAAIQSDAPAREPDADLFALASQINAISNLFGQHDAAIARFASSFTQGPISNPTSSVSRLIESFNSLRDRLKTEKASLQASQSDESAERIKLIEKKESNLILAQTCLKKRRALFEAGKTPFSFEEALSVLRKEAPSSPSKQIFDLGGKNPLFKEIAIDWQLGSLSLVPHQDVSRFAATWTGDKKDQLDQLLIDEAARLSRLSDESLKPVGNAFSIDLHRLNDATGFLVLDLQKIADQHVDSLVQSIRANWHPSHPDFSPASFSIVSAKEFSSLPETQKKLCLVVYSPSSEKDPRSPSYKTGSCYVLARGFDRILDHARQSPDEESSRSLQRDIDSLIALLQGNGFAVYRGFSDAGDLSSDYLFEQSDAYAPLLAATREDFYAKGSKRFAILECSTVEQRLLAENRIDTKEHEDLLKWRDEYAAAQVSLQPHIRYDVPKPTKSVFLSNLALSWKKYIRGDERRIIRWGLDLSGGKRFRSNSGIKTGGRSPLKPNSNRG